MRWRRCEGRRYNGSGVPVPPARGRLGAGEADGREPLGGVAVLVAGGGTAEGVAGAVGGTGLEFVDSGCPAVTAAKDRSHPPTVHRCPPAAELAAWTVRGAVGIAPDWTMAVSGRGKDGPRSAVRRLPYGGVRAAPAGRAHAVTRATRAAGVGGAAECRVPSERAPPSAGVRRGRFRPGGRRRSVPRGAPGAADRVRCGSHVSPWRVVPGQNGAHGPWRGGSVPSAARAQPLT